VSVAVEIVDTKEVLVIGLLRANPVRAWMIPVGMSSEDGIELFAEFVMRGPGSDAEFNDQFRLVLRPEVEIFVDPLIGEDDLIIPWEDHCRYPVWEVRNGGGKGETEPPFVGKLGQGGEEGPQLAVTERSEQSPDPALRGAISLCTRGVLLKQGRERL
jgi:hypothetical protein